MADKKINKEEIKKDATKVKKTSKKTTSSSKSKSNTTKTTSAKNKTVPKKVEKAKVKEASPKTTSSSKSKSNTTKTTSVKNKTVTKKVEKTEEVNVKTVTKTEELPKEEVILEEKSITEENIKEIENNTKIEPVEEETEEKDKKRKYILLLLFLLLFIFTISVAYGKQIYEAIQEQVIEVLNLNKPTAPEITGGSENWQKEALILVKKDAEAKDGLAYYEYCVSEEKNTKNCDWKKTETKNALITENGKYYVTFRAVDKEGRKGYNSNIEVVYIDNNSPKINNIVFKTITENQIQVEVDAIDSGSGIDRYEYSLDGINYQKGDKNYTYQNLETDKEYTIYIKVVDKAGNEIIVTMQAKTEKENVCTTNCDTNGDGICDLNCDTNGDGICDLNCDTNGDGICDTNCDKDNSENKPNDKPETNPNEKPETNPNDKPEQEEEKEEEIIEIPEINLDKVPSSFYYGESYDLPSYYSFGKDTGTVECIVEGKEYKDTKALLPGRHLIVCNATSSKNIRVMVEKEVQILVEQGLEESWDGWIRLNLYYPDNSTNWQYRIGKEGEIRDGYENTGWQNYLGPILVKLEDVENVYIRYDVEGETVVVAPNGKVAIDIEPYRYSLQKQETTKVKIYYDKDAKNKEYRIGDGAWQTYSKEFEVGPNTIIEARATKEEKIYDSEGEYVYTAKIKGTDSVFISEYIKTPGSDSDIGGGTDKETGKGTIKGGSTGTIEYETVTRPNGTKTTKPVAGSKPSTHLEGPTIIGNPSSAIVESVKISVIPQEEAESIYISINNGVYQEYTKEIDVNTNSLIKAYYIRKSDGKVSETSYYKIKNIKPKNKPYVKIDVTPDNYLTETVDEVKVKISGSDYNILEYSLDGVFYKPYVGEITITESTTIYAKGTNQYGTTIETETISTKTPKIEKEELNIHIEATPDNTDTDELLGSTEITIDYDPKATEKYYKIGYYGTWQEYEEPFEIVENTTIYAYCTSDNGVGTKEKAINFLTTGLSDPIITITPIINAPQVKVTIDYDKNSTINTYQIGNGEVLEYNGPFYVFENTQITAYSKNTLNHEAESKYIINNIVPNPNYLIIDKGKYFIIKLNYPESTTKEAREYKWKPNGEWKIYDEKGILLIKPEYKDEFIIEDYDGVKVEDANGKEVIFTDHYYLIDVPFNKLMENLFMRWDVVKPTSPTIYLSPEDPSKKVEVSIKYSNLLTEKYYKLITSDGKDSGWLEYEEPITIDENNVIVYAKGITNSKITSKVSSEKITNVDLVDPEIDILGDLETPQQKVTLTVKAFDNMMIHMIKMAEGKQDIQYFQEEGTSIKNNSNVTIEENGEYTFYVIDQAGHEIIKVVEVTNVDYTAPDIEIDVLTDKLSTEIEVSINYGDSNIKEYKIGENGYYQPYTENLIISSYDVLDLANEDKSLTIYARGTDIALNEQVVSKIVYVLDLDAPKEPVIHQGSGYATLTENGMVITQDNYIEFDTRNDINNQYSLDNGTTWQEYQGAFKLKNGTVIARSVKKNTGLTVESTLEIKEKTDALSINETEEGITYDEIPANNTKVFMISETIGNRAMRIYLTDAIAANSYIKIYDENNQEQSTTNLTYPITVVQLKEGSKKASIYSSSQKVVIEEISLRNETVVVEKENLPLIKVNTSEWATSKEIEITYPEGYKNEYSLDKGQTWQEYTTPFTITENKVVFARCVNDDNDVVSSSSFNVVKIDTVEPTITMDLAPKIVLGTEYLLPTTYKTGKSGGSVVCKVNDEEITNTKDLESGQHEITCTATSNSGLATTISQILTVVDKVDYTGESILKIIEENDLATGTYSFKVADEVYPVHVYALDGDLTWREDREFGDENDIATQSTYANNMVVVKVNGNLTIDEGVTVTTKSSKYGGPKGFTLYVTEELVNNGTITMTAKGAKAEGQNVYLWKNVNDDTYEFVPAIGASGGASKSGKNGSVYSDGANGSDRKTGGGGTGGLWYYYNEAKSYVGAGGNGTSYSGGAGGGASGNGKNGSAGSSVGGAGGNSITGSYSFPGGTGNPAGSGSAGNGKNGTGGLLTISSKSLINNNTISADGVSGASGSGKYRADSGASGGGSVNIFYYDNYANNGSITANGGSRAGKAGKGGNGKVTIAYIKDNSAYYPGPITSINLLNKDDHKNNWYKELNFEITTDDTNTVTNINYCVTTENSCIPNTAITVVDNKTNTFTCNTTNTNPQRFCVNSTNNLGETARTVCSDYYQVDSVIPEITEFTKEIDPNNKLTLTATDDTSGIYKYYFSVDQTNWIESDSNIYEDNENPEFIPQIYYACVEDKAGNRSEIVKSETYYQDIEINSLADINDLDLASEGYYNFKVVNDEETITYSAHVYTFDSDQVWTGTKTFGDLNDVATASDEAKNMVIVKVNGDLTVSEGATVTVDGNEYGGPKGLTLYVKGTLTNNGTITMSARGAKATGENVYLYKNADGTYEFVPAVGSTGGASARRASDGQSWGTVGKPGVNRGTGGGGSGGASRWASATSYSGAGGTGTSYSGGAGGGACSSRTGTNYGGAGSSIGGAGGNGTTRRNNKTTYCAGGGAGNPGGSGSQNNGLTSSHRGNNGTGGLLIIYTNSLQNNATISSTGVSGGSSCHSGGGSSGGGSINIFYNESYNSITDINVAGGNAANLGANGGKGTVTISQIKNGTAHTGPITSISLLNKYDHKNNWYKELNFEITTYDETETTAISYCVTPNETCDPTTQLTLADIEVNTLVYNTASENAQRICIKSTNTYNQSSDIICTGLYNVDSAKYDKYALRETFKTPPIISINNSDWTSTKLIEVSYPEGYTNEYSLDLGTSWQEYTNKITISEPTTILVRSKLEDKVVSSSSFTITKIDDTEPTIELTLEDEIELGEDYSLPTSYTVDESKSGGSAVCTVENIEYTTTKNLEAGEHEIVCTVTTGAGKTSTITKLVKIIDPTVMDSSTVLTVGQAVTAKDGSKWHVLEESSAGNETVVLLSDYNLNTDGTYNTECQGVEEQYKTYRCSTMAFDKDNNQTYNVENENNIGYFIKEIYSPLVLTTLPNTTNITLPTADQIATADNVVFNQAYLTISSSWLLTTNYWTTTASSKEGVIWNVDGWGKIINNLVANDADTFGVRPVITTIKSNLLKEGVTNE